MAEKRKQRLTSMLDQGEVEVIALSPETLTAKNRFQCHVCGKGFQRDQNLQLHRRCHSLPWDLKQQQRGGPESSSSPVKRRVYVCPVEGCVHHAPSRALGDLSGVKKHFFRKHGEKVFKCQSCSKKYAVNSDLKAHVKNCGAKAYRCDCGTVFAKKENYTSHKAYCEALAEELAKRQQANITSALMLSPPPPPPLNLANSAACGQSSGLAGSHLKTEAPPTTTAGATAIAKLKAKESPSTSTAKLEDKKNETFGGFHASPPLMAHYSNVIFAPAAAAVAAPLPPPPPQPLSFCPPHYRFPGGASSQQQYSITTAPPHYRFPGGASSQHQYSATITAPPLPPPAMSATALLQKAAQVGPTSSSAATGGSGGGSFYRGHGLPAMLNNNNNGYAKLETGGLPETMVDPPAEVLFSDKPPTLDFLGLGGGYGVEADHFPNWDNNPRDAFP